MSIISIEIVDQAINTVLQNLLEAGQDMRPIMQSIGDDVVQRIKLRFATGVGPDGQRWQPNSYTTYEIISRRLSKGNFRKDGRLNARGADKISSKRPLHGESGDLARQFHVIATDNSVTIGNSMIYAAMQQFGGVTSPRSMIPGAVIPARPFFPITAAGELYPDEQRSILETLNQYLLDAMNVNQLSPI